MNDGGPAFPTPSGYATVTELHPGYGEYRKTVEVCRTGMSLLDYFAGQALTGIMAADAHGENPFQYHSEYGAPASIAYRLAAAMLAERERVMGNNTRPAES